MRDDAAGSQPLPTSPPIGTYAWATPRYLWRLGRVEWPPGAEPPFRVSGFRLLRAALESLTRGRLGIDFLKLSEALHSGEDARPRVVQVTPSTRDGHYYGPLLISIADADAIRQINKAVDAENSAGRLPGAAQLVAADRDLAWYPTVAAKPLAQVGLVESFAGAYNLVSAPNVIHKSRRRFASAFFSPDGENRGRWDGICRQLAQDDLGSLGPGAVEVTQRILRLTMRMSVEVFAGVPLSDAEASELVWAMGVYVAWLLTLGGSSFLGINAERIPGAPHRRAFEVLRRGAARIVEQRRARGLEGATDYLGQLLLRLERDRAPDPTRDAVDETMVLLFAGHDTTASWVVSTLMLLAGNPFTQETFIADLESIRGSGRSLAGPPGTSFAGDCLLEAGRLYPPVAVLARELVTSMEITAGGVHYHLPAGSILLLDSYAAHRQTPDFGDLPETFDPGRHRRSSRRAVFFSDPGPRSCIGMTFAFHQAQAILDVLFQRHRVELALPDVTTSARGVIMHANNPEGLWLRLLPRRSPQASHPRS